MEPLIQDDVQDPGSFVKIYILETAIFQDPGSLVKTYPPGRPAILDKPDPGQPGGPYSDTP